MSSPTHPSPPFSFFFGLAMQVVEACHAFGHSFGTTSHRRRLSLLAVTSPVMRQPPLSAAPLARSGSAPALKVDTRSHMHTLSPRSSVTSPPPQSTFRSHSVASVYTAPLSRRASDASMAVRALLFLLLFLCIIQTILAHYRCGSESDCWIYRFIRRCSHPAAAGAADGR